VLVDWEAAGVGGGEFGETGVVGAAGGGRLLPFLFWVVDDEEDWMDICVFVYVFCLDER
jgi:hypothetical protein